MSCGVDDPVECPPSALPLNNARSLAASLAGTLRMARALAVAGRRIELAGIEGPIGLLCAKSLDLPPAQSGAIRLTLMILLEELDALSATLRTMHGRDAAPD